MAILRGGRRIGNYDIRIGFPRDRSLDNVNGDKRLQRRPGGSTSSGINQFVAQINQGEGLARPTRFLVVITPPQKFKLGNFGKSDPIYDDPYEEDAEAYTDNYTQNEMMRNVGLMCNKVTMPNRDVNTQEYNVYGPQRKMPYGYSYSGNLECTFYGDKFLRQRAFFEKWQSKIFSLSSHDMNFYNDYIGQMDIYQLGSFESNDDKDRITYGVRLYEVYPQTIGSYDYDYGSTDQGVSIPITLNFRYWNNLTLDDIGSATVGTAFGDVPTIKAANDFGLFGGLLNKLPPELRRAGRDVLNTTKRNLPLGPLTGGRVFPPFT